MNHYRLGLEDASGVPARRRDTYLDALTDPDAYRVAENVMAGEPWTVTGHLHRLDDDRELLTLIGVRR